MTPAEIEASFRELRSVMRDVIRRQTVQELLLRVLVDTQPDKGSFRKSLELGASDLEAHMLATTARDEDVQRILDTIEEWKRRLAR